MKLYGYWRSSAAYRVRIGLKLKELRYEDAFVHLVKGGGEQLAPDYRALNPEGLVPALQLDDGDLLAQSLAILEYLEETVPEPPLLPADPLGRARVRRIANVIACDIHPLDNLRVLNYLSGRLGVSEADKRAWYQHWIASGFTAIEALLAQSDATGRFCHGDSPGLTDVVLVPQVYNARRFEMPLDAYPTIQRIDAACNALAAFAEARPEAQGDAA